MKIYKAKDYADMSRKGANVISAQVILKPDSVLGLATGTTPIGLYENLINWYKKGDVDFSQVTSMNLDEYKGLPKENDQSYSYFMHKYFFNSVNMKPENIHLPDGTIEDAKEGCDQYNQVIARIGRMDMQLLGLGHNGHIGFNEPADTFEKQTHCVRLADSTIEANSRLFENKEDVPKYAYSMGIQTIMSSRKILLMVSGKDKAQILYDAFNGPITPQVPASVLQLHSDVTLVADEDALSVFIEKGVI